MFGRNHILQEPVLRDNSYILLTGRETEYIHNHNRQLGFYTMCDETPTKEDDKDAAALCQWAYDYYDGKRGRNEYHGWKIVDNAEELFGDKLKLEVKSSGFSSLLFTKTANWHTYYAYCTVGTKMTSWEDWFTNLSQGLIGLSPQYTRSVQNAKILHDKCLKEHSILWFIGHSLGGGLASNNSLITGRYAVTFDAAGLNILRVKMSMLMNIFYKNRQKAFFDYQGRTSKIHAYILRGEILNRVLQFIGQKAYGNRTDRIIRPNKEDIKKKWTWEKHALTNLISELDIPYQTDVDYNNYEKTTQ